MTGKWHATPNPYSAKKEEMDPDTWPLQRGFDRFYGTLAGGGNYYSPVSLMRDDEPLDPPGEDGYPEKDAYEGGTESHDLATENPEKTAELKTLYQEWARRSNVAPWPLKRR